MEFTRVYFFGEGENGGLILRSGVVSSYVTRILALVVCLGRFTTRVAVLAPVGPRAARRVLRGPLPTAPA